jgi:CheY-like chemotaxis protein
VDDDDNARAVLAQLLALRGCRVVTARDAWAAFALVQADAFDIFFLDFRMPGLNGVELATGLRRRGIEAPIVLVTGDAHLIDDARRAAAGIQRVVAKPFRMEHLAACLDLVASPTPEQPEGVTE